MIGAGGIGGYYAARLARAGHELVLTARGDHLQALRANGLTVDYEGEILRESLPAFSHSELIQRYEADTFDLIVIALKSTATRAVMNELSNWLKDASVPILSIQNGVDNEPTIAEIVGENRVLGGLAVRIGGHITDPGKVFAEGVAQIVMGAWPRQRPDDPRIFLLGQLERAYTAAGIPTTVSDNIRYELWRKLVINNGVNPLSALTGLDTRSLTHHPEFQKIVYGMMAETVAASKADNVNLGPEDLAEMFDLISNFNAIKTSMLVDKEKGRPLELDSIAGAVLRRCERLGVEAPYTMTVNALLTHSQS
ncbi:2-dehydropantoate 2-reductase [Marinobacter maroccanus]|uniref:2-dehydropantoate 2-reductase n=2 Tax=Marinobacter maroccanus TaxID=2055143 RepID=A0A2S5Z8Q5_9GAMM|nr:2-dehydropantoate 2-reductase [Marinobacter maroccanus]